MLRVDIKRDYRCLVCIAVASLVVNSSRARRADTLRKNVEPGYLLCVILPFKRIFCVIQVALHADIAREYSTVGCFLLFREVRSYDVYGSVSSEPLICIQSSHC